MQHPTMPAEPIDTLPFREGDVVGQFRIVEPIASGGMATVYRAERADRAFVQHVAVKIISLAPTQGDVTGSFLAERQILASLHHPHIVSLLDAGLTSQGSAYLIMELVDGVSITTYCRERALPLEARLRLFRQVCDAVQYAHAHFVVHRDLKPANVLVTGDGVPKVLDFGIATLLEGPLAQREDGEPSSGPGAEPLTPNYASPEQLRGERVTVASDVYALGMLLFELVAGVRAYEVGGRPRDEAIRIVGETPTMRPSDARPSGDARPPYDWRRALRGDLDAITLRACHRVPEERYASADALSEDIGRHLVGAPVDARKATLVYVIGKIARRHRVAFASAVLSSALVVGALGIAIWQAHTARVERERAVRRFDEVRALANTVIFKIHDAIAPLPGSTPVRQTIITEGLTYLERLSADAAGDPGLQLELGRAYIKIGEVQGRPNMANLGDYDGAVGSFRKAKALLEPLAQRPDAPAAVFGSYLDAIRFSSETLASIGGSHRAEALKEAQDAVNAAERFSTSHPLLDQAKSFMGAAEFTLAQRLSGQQAMDHWRKAGAAYDALLARSPDDPVRQRNVALVEKYVGGSFDHDQNYAASLEHHTRALELDQKRFDRAPEDRLVQFDLAIDLSNVAYGQWREKRLTDAIALYARSLSMRERLLATDPEDALSQGKVAFIHRQLGALYQENGNSPLALKHYRLACAEVEAIQTKTADTTILAADSWTGIGHLERDRPAVSCDAYRQAFDLYRRVTEHERRGRADGDADSMPAVAAAAARCGYVPAGEWLRSALNR
jgi:serine/threonine protein kinase